MKRAHIATWTLITGLVLTTAYAPAWAEAQPLALRSIMKELGSNMRIVTDGISREDWGLVDKTAPLIADHSRPPLLEKTRILGFLGGDMAKFKSRDDAAHEAAKALGLAARNQDGQAVIAAFQKLQMRCYDCHREFRKPFVAHFYGAR